MKRRGGVQIALGAAAVMLTVGSVRAAEPPMLAPACRAIAADAAWSDCAGSVEGQALLVEPAVLRLAATDRSQAAAVAAPLVPAIPEPPAYVLMLAGIAAVGFLATRRRRE